MAGLPLVAGQEDIVACIAFQVFIDAHLAGRIIKTVGYKGLAVIIDTLEVEVNADSAQKINQH